MFIISSDTDKFKEYALPQASGQFAMPTDHTVVSIDKMVNRCLTLPMISGITMLFLIVRMPLRIYTRLTFTLINITRNCSQN